MAFEDSVTAGMTGSNAQPTATAPAPPAAPDISAPSPVSTAPPNAPTVGAPPAQPQEPQPPALIHPQHRNMFGAITSALLWTSKNFDALRSGPICCGEAEGH